MNETIISIVQKYDLKDCVEIYGKAFERNEPRLLKETLNFWNGLLSENLAVFFKIESSGQLAGTGALILHNQTASIAFLSILPDYRGKGLGNKLFHYILKTAGEKKYKRVELFASRQGKSMYRKAGFTAAEEYSRFTLTDRNKQVDTSNCRLNTIFEDWMLDLDLKATGTGRSSYLKYYLSKNGRIISYRNDGFGVISNNTIGPVISLSGTSALKIISKARSLGANKIISPASGKQYQILSEYFLLETPSAEKLPWMSNSEERVRCPDFIYALGSFASG